MTEEIKTYSVAEIAKILGVSKPLIYKEMSNGKIPYRQIGSKKFFIKEDIDSIIAKSLRPALKA